jgi:DNA-entry nuclease
MRKHGIIGVATAALAVIFLLKIMAPNAAASTGRAASDAADLVSAAGITESYGTAQSAESEETASEADESKDGGFSLSEIPEYSGKPWIEVNDNAPSFTSADMTTAPYIKLSPWDSFNRCGAAEACLGQDTMPGDGEKRESISAIKPSGWNQKEYDCIEQGMLYNRCHLLGYQLAGNFKESLRFNLVTGTRYLNIDGNLPFENKVAEYIRTTGNHVLYRVTPVYNGFELVCRGELMEGMSVEDNGTGIRFSVYCYNVQPGISINYSDGSSEYTGVFLDKTGSSVILPEESGEETDNAVTQEEQKYVLNKSSMKFHFPECDAAVKISSKNREEVTATRDELVNEGYSPCGICSP